MDQVPNSSNDPLTILFPNWSKAVVASFDVTICRDVDCPGTPACNVVGMTIFNYGNAVGGTDISAVYYRMLCGKTPAWETMTYAGIWSVGASSYPAWTWDGNLAWGGEPQFTCADVPNFTIFADVAPCPTDGATVTMGLGYNNIANPVQPGGMWDECGWQVPSWDQPRTGRPKYIRYVTKTADKDYVPPGDTITYRIYYGRPGGPVITQVVILDTLPVTTHYVAGSASTAPDPAWAPDPGPPPRLRWTLPGFASTAGGATNELSFQVTVDWGNGEAFEPGSGDVGAVEGSRLNNQAFVEFWSAGCGAAYVNPPTDTVVRRYMLWQVADQDLLFSPRPGFPNDEVIYSIFIRNMSTTRTWWDLSVWDTVPPEVTVWLPNLGFYDPVLGWTMTPSGVAPGNPSWVESVPGTTLLNWILDLPPGATRELRWKGSAGTGAAVPNSTAVSRAEVMALGAPGQVGGSGHAGKPRGFTHLAKIVLRTTYFSYVGQAADSIKCEGLMINFYPLNKAAAFELRKLVYEGKSPIWSGAGGKSDSIIAFQGSCAGFADGGYGGCGLERSPAQYWWPISCVEAPNAALFKMTSNAPLLWLLMPHPGAGGDAFTYIPSTSLNSSGFTHYSFRRGIDDNPTVGWGESWVVFNTGLDIKGSFDPDRTTTVHIFKWDPTFLNWQYATGGDIAGNSLWMPFAGCNPVDEQHYKLISSDARVTVYQGYGTFGDPSITYAYNEHGALVPNAENGLNTSTPGSAGTFYVIAHHLNNPMNMLVGNHSPVTDATFRVYHYRPDDPGLASQGIPNTLCGRSGNWDLIGNRTATAGLAGVDNAHVFGFTGTYDNMTLGTGSTANAWKIEWAAGGNISVLSGSAMFREWAGGSLMHPVSGTPTGQEFWFHHADSSKGVASWTIMLFCHSAGMAVRGTSSDGADSTYTTDGPDQCIAFMALSDVSGSSRRNWRFELLAAGAPGEMVAMYHQGQYREKFFTAPFMSTGLHYDIIAPPVVFTGQSFWITVVAVLGTGTTKTDYDGTTSFSSSDPLAMIMGAPMDGYDYVWAPATDQGVRVFVNVTLSRLGLQTLVAGDTVDGSVTGITAIMVVGVDVKFTKEPPLQVSASGDEIRFKICWSNYSSGTATNFVITDRVPDGMTYIQDTAANHFCGATGGFGAATVAYSTTDSAPASFLDMPGGGTAAAVTWLRWTIPTLGVRTTGCGCFTAQVD